MARPESTGPGPDRPFAPAHSPADFRQQVAIIALFSALLMTGIFIPAYVDDILYLLMTGRAGYDGWRAVTAFNNCGPEGAGVMPLILLPGRALSWVVHYAVNDLYSLRTFSMAVLLTWLAYTAWFLRRCLFPAQTTFMLFAAIVGGIGLGTLPFAMVLARPEIPLAFAVTFFASLPFIIRAFPAPAFWKVACMAILFAQIVSWFFCVHAKALFYLPVVLIAAWSLRRWNKIAGPALAVFTVIAAYDAWEHYWAIKLACPDSLILRHVMESVAVLPSAFSDSPHFLRQVLGNLANTIFYWREITLPYGGWWLPDLVHPVVSEAHSGALAVLHLLYSLLWVVTQLLVLAAVAWHLAWGIGSAVASARDALAHGRAASAEFLIPLMLLAACLMHCLLQSQAMFYNFLLIWVVFLLAEAFFGAYLLKYTSYWQERAQKLTRLRGQLMLTAIVSQGTLLLSYAPAILTLVFAPADNSTVPYRGTISEQHYAETRDHVLAAAKKCGIATDAGGRHVIVDRYTYLPLKATQEPLLPAYTYHEFDEPKPFVAFLHAWNASGVVTLCSSLPVKLRPLMQQYEGVCCLSKTQITRLNPP